MRMRVAPFVVAALLGVATASLVACGSTDRSKLIPKSSANRLKSALAEVKTGVDAGNCAAAARGLTRARSALVRLPSSVDSRLVSRLREGLSRLEQLAPRECAGQQTQTTTVPTTETTTPATTPTHTTTTETTQSDTTPTQTTTTTPPATTTTAPPTPTTTTTPPAATTGGAGTP